MLLSIPEDLYEQIETEARESETPVDAVIVRALRRGFTTAVAVHTSDAALARPDEVLGDTVVREAERCLLELADEEYRNLSEDELLDILRPNEPIYPPLSQAIVEEREESN